MIDRLAERRVGGLRYQIAEEIARGGMGSVVKVWDGDLRRIWR
jgi:hypothetical protein